MGGCHTQTNALHSSASVIGSQPPPRNGGRRKATSSGAAVSATHQRHSSAPLIGATHQRHSSAPLISATHQRHSSASVIGSQPPPRNGGRYSSAPRYASAPLVSLRNRLAVPRYASAPLVSLRNRLATAAAQCWRPLLEAAPLISVLVALVAIRKITINECLVWHVYSSHQLPHAPRMGGCHAQTNTLLSSSMPLYASSMRHCCCPSSSTYLLSIRLSRRRSRFI